MDDKTSYKLMALAIRYEEALMDIQNFIGASADEVRDGEILDYTLGRITEALKTT